MVKENLKQAIKNHLPATWLERRRQYLNRWKYHTVERKHPGDYYSLAPFDYYRCVFVHIPKSAGVSVSKTLFGNLGGGHKTFQAYQRFFPEATLDQYFKFTFVRHPYTRVQSAYHYLKQGGMNATDQAWSNEHLAEVPSFDVFVAEHLARTEIQSWQHFRPQVAYLQDTTGKLRVDFIGRFESLQSDFDQVCEAIGVEARPLRRENWSPPDRNPISAEAKAHIYEIYREDFERLNYGK
jgi:hypothetical protein